MNYNDRRALAAVNHTAQYDAMVKDEIKKAIDSHDRAFFAQVVSNVLHRLRITVSDVGEFINAAYEWFRNWI